MGTAMAERLVTAGYRVSVYNRDHRKATRLADLGATVFSTPAELAERCDVIVGCLLDTVAVRQVYLDDEGIIPRMRPGSIVVEHGTFDPALAREAAAAASARGGAFLDAPVTGGPDGAATGTLTIMVGGNEAAFTAVRRLLQTYGGQILRVGAAGSGVSLKLVNQLLVSCHLSAAAEAAALIDACGLDATVSQRVLDSGWAASAMLARSLPLVATGSFASTGATVGGLLEVQRLVRNLASDAGLDLATFGTACGVFEAADTLGLSGCDPASLVQVFRAGAALSPEPHVGHG
jgi:3-hydroxyisobutyrate dehydrogenase-like beta-hydroxyacid dehydrogenase